MSFSWFIGLHVPILYTLCTGNTTLARSMWPASFFDDQPTDDVSSMAPIASHPQPHSRWYPALFFALLTLTCMMYFTAALSYPGYVDEEYRRRKADGGAHSRDRDGYARVDAAEAAESKNDDVRIDMRSTVRRIMVDDGSIDPNVAPSSTRLPSPSIPASAVGEASEAELSIGCAPPVALPLLESLGLSRAQIHAADQTGDLEAPDALPDQTAEPLPGEDEYARLTTNSSSEIELGNSNRSGPAINAAAAVSSSNSVPTTTTTTRIPSAFGIHAVPSPSTSSGYCNMCRLVRPARSKHCYKCRHCVCKFDHHCPFIANCIGANNHRYFLIYLWCQVATMMWAMTLNTEPYLYAYTTKSFYAHAAIMIIMIGQLMVSSMLWSAAHEYLPMRGFAVWIGGHRADVAIGRLFALCSVCSMFHSWLALTNQTTYQVIKMQDSAMAQSPQAVAARRMQRRQRNRQAGGEEVKTVWSVHAYILCR
jgi:hypothetical protein